VEYEDNNAGSILWGSIIGGAIIYWFGKKLEKKGHRITAEFINDMEQSRYALCYHITF